VNIMKHPGWSRGSCPYRILHPLTSLPADSGQAGQEGQAKKESGGPDNLAALEKTVTELSKKLTVTMADENYKVVVGGAIIADFLYNSARPVAPGTPFFLAPGPAPGFRQQTFDASARQTTLSAVVLGPEFCGFQPSAVIVANFYSSSLIEDLWGFLPSAKPFDLAKTMVGRISKVGPPGPLGR
jgi:hypothetical protein